MTLARIGRFFCYRLSGPSAIDGQTKEDGTVTVRDRDTGAQERIDKFRVPEYLADKLNA